MEKKIFKGDNMEKYEKVITIAGIITVIVVLVFIIIFAFHFIEMLNDHRCYNLPLNEFYQDERCERYWDFKEWQNQ